VDEDVPLFDRRLGEAEQGSDPNPTPGTVLGRPPIQTLEVFGDRLGRQRRDLVGIEVERSVDRPGHPESPVARFDTVRNVVCSESGHRVGIQWSSARSADSQIS
jgi:hypothetical protein